MDTFPWILLSYLSEGGWKSKRGDLDSENCWLKKVWRQYWFFSLSFFLMRLSGILIVALMKSPVRENLKDTQNEKPGE